MVPFRGTFDHTLDAKSRLTVPARYRATLADGVVLDDAPGPEAVRGRVAAAATTSATRAAQIGRVPRAVAASCAELERFFFGSSHETELDGAGRVMIPSFLAEHATLQKEVVVVGAGKRMELWNKAAWSEHRPELLSSVAEVTARVDAGS